jgi:hypothetical protein
MAAGSSEVTQAIENIASVSQENSAAVEEVSASAEEVSAQVQEVHASAQSLSQMAEELRRLVAQFRLPDRDQSGDPANALVKHTQVPQSARRHPPEPVSPARAGYDAGVEAFPTGDLSAAEPAEGDG